MRAIEPVRQFTKEQFLCSTEPYEYLYSLRNDSFTLQRTLAIMSEMARNTGAGVRNFTALFKAYCEAQQKKNDVVYVNNTTNFTGQSMELDAGDWEADDCGIRRYGGYGGLETACSHPIMPVLRLVNIDTGVEKLKLAYCKGKQWRSCIYDKKTLASNNTILNLAEVGIAVNSENSRLLVQYLADIEHLNYDQIPEKNSVCRLGWIEGEGFSPYVDNLVFDGEVNFKTFFESVTQKGSFEKWIELAVQSRKYSTQAKILLASSFASVLVKIVGALPFILHLWGSQSGTGKTVGLMLATSVWANPEMGKYIRTFNGTTVSWELSAGFVNNLPLILDEFQMMSDKKKFETSVYMFAEGAGKGRGQKQGGLQTIPTWRNCIITSGEMPITNFVTGAGALNRVVEVECTDKVFENAIDSLAVMRGNYGHAGKKFVELLQGEENADRVKAIYQDFYNAIIESDATEKQTMAGALILTADKLATELIFKDNNALTVEEISPYLQTKTEVDINERAYNYVCETVAANSKKFVESNEYGEVWGKIEDNTAYIIRNVFDRICFEGGYSSKAFLSWLMRQKMVEVSYNKNNKKPIPTKPTRINGSLVRCVALQLQGDELDEIGLIDDI